MLGFLFESLVVRDLRVYAQAVDAEALQYRDNTGLEVDAIVETADGRWGAFEVKLGAGMIDQAAASLRKFADRVDTRHAGARPAGTAACWISAEELISFRHGITQLCPLCPSRLVIAGRKLINFFLSVRPRRRGRCRCLQSSVRSRDAFMSPCGISEMIGMWSLIHMAHVTCGNNLS